MSERGLERRQGDSKDRARRLAVGDIVRRAANRRPNSVALIEPRTGRELTYAQFDRRVNQTARAFRTAGLESGDRLAIVADNSIEFLLAYFGAMKAGVVAVLLNTQLTPADLQYQLADAEVEQVVVEAAYAESVAPYVEQGDATVLATIDDGDAGDAPSLRSLVEAESDDPVSSGVRADDVAQIMYTSGTTGDPKGVVHTHRSAYMGSINQTVTSQILRTDTIECVMPLYHCAQLAIFKGSLHVCAPSVIRRGFDPDAVLADIEEYDVSWLFLLPAMFRTLVERDDISERDLSSVRRCLYAMTPIGNDTLAEAIETFDADFALGSGQTEAYPVTCAYQPEWQMEKEGNYWGTAAANTEIGIMEDGELLPRGETGEIVYRGPNLMREYLNAPEETAEAFEHGWFHSGDLGYFDDDGLLKFVDRKKDVVKTGGETVSTQKVESFVLSAPGVEEAAVVGLPHDRWGEAVTAFVVGTDPDREDLLDRCRSELAEFEVPKDVITVDELPRNSLGKVQKFELQSRYEDHYRE